MSVRYTENVKIDVKESVRNDIENIHTSSGTKRKRAVRVNNNVIQVDSIDKIQNKGDLDAYVARFLDGLEMQDFNIREVFEYTMALGKKYYETNVVPKLLTVLCNTKPNHYQRKKVVPLATGDVVEIGVGPGLNLQYYNFEKVNKVIGIDPSDELNKIAKKNADKVNLDIEFNLSSAESIDLPTSSVDSVVCTFSLCSIPDPNKALNEIFRILKPGGKYFFCEHGISPDMTTRLFQNVTNIFYPKLSGGCHANRDIPKLITDAGLNIIEKDTMYLPGSVKFLGYNYWGVAVR